MTLPARSAPDLLREAVLSWLAGKSPEDLRGRAERGVDLVADLRREFSPWQITLGQILAGEQGRRALAAMTGADFEPLIDEALQRWPAHGLVLWAHRDWFLRQVLAVRDAFIG